MIKSNVIQSKTSSLYLDNCLRRAAKAMTTLVFPSTMEEKLASLPSDVKHGKTFQLND